MILDFRRDAPGRTRNSASSTNAAAAAQRRLEEKIFTVLFTEDPSGSLDDFQRPLPAGLVKEVKNYFTEEKLNPIGPFCLAVLVIRSFKRPVNKHRPPDDIFLGNKSPIAAVQTDATMIAHGEVMVGRNHDVIALNVCWHIDRPVRPHIRIIARRNRRKIVAVNIGWMVSVRD